MLKTIKKAPERQSFSGVNSILPQRGKGILPTGVIVACPRGANSRGVSTAVLAAYFNYFIMVERFYQLTIYRLSEKTCTFAHVIWVLMQKQR